VVSISRFCLTVCYCECVLYLLAHDHLVCDFALSVAAAQFIKQESCAIAKMIAQCALYMVALKIFGTPWLRPRLLFPTFFISFCSDRPYMNVPTKFEVRGFTRSWDNRGYPKNWTVPGYAHAPFSPKFLVGFYSDWPAVNVPAEFEVRIVSEILPLLFPRTPLFPTPPLVSPKLSMFPWEYIGGSPSATKSEGVRL